MSMNEQEILNELNPATTAESWQITNDLAADWTLDKIRDSQAELTRFEMVVRAKIEQLQLALQKKQGQAAMDEGFFRFKLREYFNTVKCKETKTQRSYDLPSGKLKLKSKLPEYKQDKEQLLAWAQITNPHFVKTKEEASWEDIKGSIEIIQDVFIETNTGEIMLGVEELLDPGVIMDSETGEILDNIEFIKYPIAVYQGKRVPGIAIKEREAEFKIEF